MKKVINGEDLNPEYWVPSKCKLNTLHAAIFIC